jgi:hypothetical protein
MGSPAADGVRRLVVGIDKPGLSHLLTAPAPIVTSHRTC